jgi:hypothetical protein
MDKENIIDPKLERAKEIAETIIQTTITKVKMADVNRWPEDDLYIWLEIWDYHWNGTAWVAASK